MKSPLIALLALLSLGTSLAAQTKIMCVGDSITWGTRQLFQDSVGGYRLPLTVRMDNAGWSYDMVGSQADGPTNPAWDRDHEGYRGWKIEEIEAIMANRLATYAPDVILLLIGTNNRGEGAATAFPRMEPLLNTIFTNSPDVEVYVGTLTPRTDSSSTPPGPQFAIDFNAQLPALINAQVDLGRTVHLVDLFGGTLGVDIIDGVHPTLGGYHRMAEIWFEALSATLGDTTGNKPPSVTITSPADGSTLAAGSPLTIDVTASDPDGSIDRVDFLIDQAFVGSATSSSGGTWSLTLPEPPVGTHQLRAVAFDNRGAAYATLATTSISISGTAPFSFGLVGHWPMKSGHRYHIFDESGYGLRLHRAEFAEFIDSASSPSGDGALAIPGGLGFAAHASHLDFTEDFSFVGWVKWGGTDGLYQTIIEKGDNYKIATYQVNPGDTTAEIYLRIRKTSGTSNIRSGISLNEDTWHFLAVSKDGGQVTFRIDDTTTTIGGPSTMETNTDKLTIGSSMDFSFDEFRLYDRALTTVELDALENLFAGSSPPPADPGNPSATAIAYNQIDVTWTDNSDNETSFVIERSLAGGGSGFSIAGTTGPNTNSFSDTTVDPDTTYFYRVFASNVTADSSPTAEASAATPPEPTTPPLAPSGLSAQAVSADQINLAWTDNSGRETGFAIERSENGGATFSEIHVTGENVASYMDTGLSELTTYAYRVVARNTYGDSSPTSQASAQTWPASVFPVSESFELGSGYTAGNPLNGQNGWSAGSAVQVVGTGLTSDAMAGEEDGAIGYTSTFFNDIVTSAVYGTDDRDTTGEIWFAGLVALDANYNTDHSLLHIDLKSGNSGDFSVGIRDGNYVLIESTSGFTGTQNYVKGSTALIVGRVSIVSLGGGINEEFDVWFNPTDVSNEAGLDSTAAGKIARNFTIFSGNWGAITIGAEFETNSSDAFAYADEIRVAETLEDLNLSANLTPAQAWRMFHFGTSENTGAAANENDVEPDGLSNIMERATGRDPHLSDTLETPIFTGTMEGSPDVSGDYWLFTIPRITGGSVAGDIYTADGIEYGVLWSDNLNDWHADVAEYAGSAPSGIDGIEEATYRVARSFSPEIALFRLSVNAVGPVAPSALASPAFDHNSVTLNWDDNADDESGYCVEYSTDGITFTALDPLPANSTSVEIASLSPETEYTFRVYAIGVEGDSPYTAALSITTTSTPTLNGLSPFHIGNSLTQMRSIPQQVTAFALDDGFADHSSIQSTIGGHFLWEHWQGVDGSTAPDNIVNGSYDNVILQGNSAEWEPGRIANFRSNAQNFHNAGVTNQDAQTWIYSYWPGRNGPLQRTRYVSAAFEDTRDQLTGGKWPRIIPVGDAVEYFVKQRNAGNITGIPRNDFYSDTIHPSPTGGYFISLVHYASLYGISPVGLPANNGVTSVSQSLATEMQTTIWEFLQKYPYAGVHAGMPAVEFTADVYSGFAPLTVNFDASSSSIPDGTESVASISWDILREGDVTPTSATGLTLEEVFTVPGIYHVTATATSSNGRESFPLSQSIRVSAVPSTASIGINFNTSQGGSVSGGDYAGIVPQQNWNNYSGKNSGSIGNLVDNSGSPSGSSLTLTSPGGFKSQGVYTFDNPDFRLLHGWVRAESGVPLVVEISGLPTAFSSTGYTVYVYSNAFPNTSEYSNSGQIEVDWSADASVDQTLSSLPQWAMADYDETRPDYDYTDSTGSAQFYNTIAIPAGHSSFSLSVTASNRFAVSGIQIVANP